ncbi:hypothetical protein [Streptomyces lonarensis]|uniref:Uncharacterized protein n=1 Tax=Streptomyces lonarensis TaxID=700599 RepID=A0A7X6HYK3_9ACTN|nr:hypothetical protein [Streptomyces lonarensis]NJQ05505.1 hypothetical protein [Streptomyces lonarensis]
MREYVGPHEVRTLHDMIELSLGIDPELFLGVEGESCEERAARLDAARDIMAEDPELFDQLFRLAMRAPGAVRRLRPLAPTARRLAAKTAVAA